MSGVERDPIYHAIGVVLRRRREALGWSQGGLAMAVGCEATHVSEHELGKRALQLYKLREYARALRCTAAELMAEAERECVRPDPRATVDRRQMELVR